MKKVISTERIPIKLWLDDIEDGALEQAKNLANLKFAVSHVAIMPDSHQGYGMPIGGVLATEGVIIPNAVGVDIGCGMCAVKTNLVDITIEQLKLIMGGIRKVVPVGFNRHKEKQHLFDSMPQQDGYFYPIVEREWQKALTQIGTLGGGNHFIEIQKGNDGHIWLMIHSGSRNLGLQVAQHYNKLAEEMNERWHSDTKKELAFLPLDTNEGKQYVREMSFCVKFALANRNLMMDRIMAVVHEHTQATFEPMINIAHNYAIMEHHFGKDILVHRKGATLAREGTIGIIPGSMGTASYIVKGKGNTDSFTSCSHGAGRRMGRKQAIRELNLEEEQKKMEGVLGKPRSQQDLEEAPGAYKDISVVMENQKDLVDIVVELKPLAVIKG